MPGRGRVAPANVLRLDRGRAEGIDEEPLLLAWGNLGEGRLLAPGQVLFLQGEPASHIYVVVEGRVEMVHVSSDGRKFVSFEAHRGDVLGEAALMQEAPYPSSAESASQARVLRLRGDTVAALLREGATLRRPSPWP